MRLLLIAPLLALCACATRPPPPPPAERIVIQEKLVPVQRPCPVTIPAKPAPLDRPLPRDSVALAAQLAKKLIEWAGPGGYGERADQALHRCVDPEPDAQGGTPGPTPTPTPTPGN